MPGHSPVTSVAMRKRGFLLASEAARKVSVAPQTVYRWLDAEKITGLTKGSYRRYVRWSSVLKHLGAPACDALGLDSQDIWTETPND